jgi:hypothetical protein
MGQGDTLLSEGIGTRSKQIDTAMPSKHSYTVRQSQAEGSERISKAPYRNGTTKRIFPPC